VRRRCDRKQCLVLEHRTETGVGERVRESCEERRRTGQRKESCEEKRRTDYAVTVKRLLSGSVRGAVCRQRKDCEEKRRTE